MKNKLKMIIWIIIILTISVVIFFYYNNNHTEINNINISNNKEITSTWISQKEETIYDKIWVSKNKIQNILDNNKNWNIDQIKDEVDKLNSLE